MSLETRQQYDHAQSLADPAGFWAQAAKAIDWAKQPTTILDRTNPMFPAGCWFNGGKINTCYNAIDRHISAGRGNQPALIWDSAVTNTVNTFSYSELLVCVSDVARMLQAHGVGMGSTVLIYMPLVPEAVFAMLACARLGAIHSVVFGGFAAHELAKRITDCKPVLILAASCGIEPSRIVLYKPLIDKALTLCSHKPSALILLQRPQAPALNLDKAKREFDWNEHLQIYKDPSSPVLPPVYVDADHPLYLLYTSGSTGTPKGVVRDNGGHAVALNWAVTNVFGLTTGDVIFSAILYEGKPVGTPDAGAFWRIVSQHKVNVLFTAPTAIRAIKREDPDGEILKKYNIPSLRNLFLAGERSDPDTINHFHKLLGVPVRDNFWQTETGWPVAAPCAAVHLLDSSPIRVGSAGRPVAGYDVRVLVTADMASECSHDVSGIDPTTSPVFREAQPGESGNLVVKLPLPPGCLPTLWNNSAGFLKSYLTKFPGYFDLTDSGYIDRDGFVYIMSRTDDVINTAGHRISTGSIEQIVAAHGKVAECAVVGKRDTIKGEKPIGFVVLKYSHAALQLEKPRVAVELVDAVREKIGPFACFHQVYFVDKLPKTRSGKILRRTLRSMVNGDTISIPPTIEDETVLGEIALVLKSAKL
ncbi:hypothetical protein BASA60_007789 [Batrachochytrium salamandrivorans]|nr:hypothetical protein BASA60_007789 [Batrachochytrium salamandrivorans]